MDAESVVPIAVAFAVEFFGVTAVASCPCAKANVAGKGLGKVAGEVEHRTIVADTEVFVFEVIVTDATVEHDAGFGFGVVELCVGVHASPALVEPIVVGRLYDIAFAPLLRGDAAGAEVEVRSDAKCKLLTDVHIGEFPSIFVRTLQVAVTELFGFGGNHHSGVEVADTRSIDGGAKGEFQRVEHIELVLHACRRHPVAEVAVEVFLLAIEEFGAEVAVFVAHTGACRPGSIVESVAHVHCCHLCEVLKVALRVAFRESFIVEKGFTFVATVDVFQAGFKFVIFGKGAAPVDLCGLFEEILGHIVVGSRVRDVGAHHII